MGLQSYIDKWEKWKPSKKKIVIVTKKEKSHIGSKRYTKSSAGYKGNS